MLAESIMVAVDRCSAGGEVTGGEGERCATDLDVSLVVLSGLERSAALREALEPVFSTLVVLCIPGAEEPPFFKARSCALKRLRSS